MGRSGRHKIERRLEQARVQAAFAAHSQIPDDKRTFLSWFRGIGLASICAGIGCLFTTFFWPAVVFLYAGLGLIAFDFYLKISEVELREF
jgi:hypothetical protein